MRLRAAAAMLGLAWLAGCAAANSPEACRVTKLGEAAVDLSHGRPLVEVVIAGQKARLLLDTGASGVLISEQARARLGLQYDLAAYGSSTSVGAQAPARLTQPIAIGLGGFELKPVRLLVISSATDLDALGYDGLLGTSALAAYDVLLDFPAKRVALYAPRVCPLGASPLSPGSFTVAVPPTPQQWLRVPVRVEGRDLSLVLDTGASRTYLKLERMGLSAEALASDREIRINSAGPGALRARLHRFAEMQVGPEVQHGALLLVGELRTSGDGLLGMEFLRRRQVWLSFAGWAVTFGAAGS